MSKKDSSDDFFKFSMITGGGGCLTLVITAVGIVGVILSIIL